VFKTGEGGGPTDPWGTPHVHHTTGRAYTHPSQLHPRLDYTTTPPGALGGGG